MSNGRFKQLYITVNAILIIAMLVLLVRAADKTAASYMALLAACGAFAAFNGYWSINRSLYSWFRRDSDGSGRRDTYKVLIAVGTLLLILCAVWLFI